MHIVAGSVDQAREQWIQAAGRNRADLGLDQARAAATAEAQNYAPDSSRAEQQRSASTAGTRGASFAERMRQFPARFAADRPADDAVNDELPAHDEWDDGIDEHQDHDTPTQSGPHL